MTGSIAPTTLPPEIQIEQLSPEGVRYILPRRPLGNYRWFALAPFIFSLIGVSFFWGLFSALTQAPMPFTIIVSVVAAIPALSAVGVPLAISAAILWGHSSIEIRRGRIKIAEHVGPLHWSGTRPVALFRRMRVRSSINQNASRQASAPAPRSPFADICLETVRGKTHAAVFWYPREWLLPLAQELARQATIVESNQFSEAGFSRADANAPTPIEVVDDLERRQQHDQPPGSQIVMTEQPGSIAFEIPPTGLKGGAKVLFVFACVWLTFMAVITMTMIFEFAKQQQHQLGGAIFGVAFLAMFWLVGVGMMVGALQMARWRAAIAVAHARCLVVQVGLFGEKRETWEPGELTAIQVGPSSVEINEKPVMQLQFVPRVGKIFGVLSARDVSELEWLATKLSEALGLASDLLTADIETQPPDSDVVCDERPAGLTISVPRQAWGQGSGGLWIMALVWNALIWTALIGVFVFKSGNLAEMLFPLMVMGILALVGLAMIGAALQMSFRRAEIAFANDRLLVLQFGLFGTRRYEWAVEELSAIRAGNSGASINNRPLMQLQIVPCQGKPVTLLTGRDDRELAWIATTLRRATGAPADSA